MKLANRFVTLAAAAISLVALAGCTMCHTPHDETYNAFGGKWERLDMMHGRVGSAFAPAEAEE